MNTNIRIIISNAREAYQNSSIVILLCDTLEKHLEIDEANLVIKQNLSDSLKQEQERSALLQREVDRLRLALPDTTNSFAQQRLQTLVSELQQPLRELKELNEGVPPLSRECLRQHAAIGALNGILAHGRMSPEDVAKYAVRHADALVKELAK